MNFQSYKKERHYTEGDYAPGGIYFSHRGTENDGLCKNCGYAYGYHYGPRCPSEQDVNFSPTFYNEIDKLNSNTKVI